MQNSIYTGKTRRGRPCINWEALVEAIDITGLFIGSGHVIFRHIDSPPVARIYRQIHGLDKNGYNRVSRRVEDTSNLEDGWYKVVIEDIGKGLGMLICDGEIYLEDRKALHSLYKETLGRTDIKNAMHETQRKVRKRIPRLPVICFS